MPPKKKPTTTGLQPTAPLTTKDGIQVTLDELKVLREKIEKILEERKRTNKNTQDVDIKKRGDDVLGWIRDEPEKKGKLILEYYGDEGGETYQRTTNTQLNDFAKEIGDINQMKATAGTNIENLNKELDIIENPDKDVVKKPRKDVFEVFKLFIDAACNVIKYVCSRKIVTLLTINPDKLQFVSDLIDAGTKGLDGFDVSLLIYCELFQLYSYLNEEAIYLEPSGIKPIEQINIDDYIFNLSHYGGFIDEVLGDLQAIYDESIQQLKNVFTWRNKYYIYGLSNKIDKPELTKNLKTVNDKIIEAKYKIQCVSRAIANMKKAKLIHEFIRTERVEPINASESPKARRIEVSFNTEAFVDKIDNKMIKYSKSDDDNMRDIGILKRIEGTYSTEPMPSSSAGGKNKINTRSSRKTRKLYAIR